MRTKEIAKRGCERSSGAEDGQRIIERVNEMVRGVHGEIGRWWRDA